MKGQNESAKDTTRPGTARGSLESAAHDTGRDAQASPGHDATTSERSARIGAEQQRLRDWAKQNGKLRGQPPARQ